jgi:hypothetical protein
MPHVNLWLRNKNVDTWEAIPKNKRSEFFNAQLENYRESGTRLIKLPQFDKAIRVPSNKGLCPNGHVADEWGKCLMRECKYGR